MKTRIQNLFLLPALIAGLGLIPAGRVAAQTFTTLHSFTNGSDGAFPYFGGVIISGSTLYGTTAYGGNNGGGTVFRGNTDGTGFTNLHNFNLNLSSDAAIPYCDLILSSNTLYGTAGHGGPSAWGSVFAVNTDGTGFTNLYGFTAPSGSPSINSNGATPDAGLILSSNTLYGTAFYGGSAGNGTVFAVNTDGTGFTNLHSFTATSGSPSTNSDGANPHAGLILSSNILYGVTYGGGSLGNGTAFAINADGTGFTNLHNFAGGSDGANPYARLIASGNTLYGTAQAGGSAGNGTVFKFNKDGTGYTNLHVFIYIDGVRPLAGLILSGNTLYGTTQFGGIPGFGTVFGVKTDGTGFTNLYTFTEPSGPFPFINSDGVQPGAGLTLSGYTLYGTAGNGGSSGYGTVFSLSFAPQVTLIPSGSSLVFKWPTNVAGFDYTGFTLQSTTNLGASAFWTTVLPGPVVVNGQNTVTNPISGTNTFYRLSL
ncbi:MAG: hypothetical protein HY298_24970 [Verrucomicrobia bacterium]|nr:hypothetical protein [Verrucomicrobiota bacterium]